jgi:hypothetical protein
MNTNRNKNVHRVVESATALVVIGVAMNIVVMQTLGSFDAASVILALYLGFWVFVLGSTVLILSSIWLFMRRRVVLSQPMSAKPAADKHGPIGLQVLGHNRMCGAR